MHAVTLTNSGAKDCRCRENEDGNIVKSMYVIFHCVTESRSRDQKDEYSTTTTTTLLNVTDK